MARNARRTLSACLATSLSILLALGGAPCSAIAEGLEPTEELQVVEQKDTERAEEGVEERAEEGVEEATEATEALIPQAEMPAGEKEGAYYAYGQGATPVKTEALSVHDENESADSQLLTQGTLPRSYDSRSAGLVTSVKDQNPYGTCWAFTTIAALESSLLAHNKGLSASSLDLSERHLAYFTFHQQNDALGNIAGDATRPTGVNYGYDRLEADPYLASGSDFNIASMALASWAGAVREEVAPYSELISKRSGFAEVPQYDPTGYSGAISSSTKGAQFLQAVALDPGLARSKNYAWLTGFRHISFDDRDDVKSAIIQNGGVAASINSNKKYTKWFWDGSKSIPSIYNYDPEVKTNHEVEIVGWDDDYDRMKFGNHTVGKVNEYSRTPPQDAESLTLNTPLESQISSNGQKYLRFEPAEDGLYRFQTTISTNPAAYVVDTDSGKLVTPKCPWTPDTKSIDIEMLAGKTYYLYIMAGNQGGTETLTLTRLGNIDYSDVPTKNGAWLAKNSYGSGVDYEADVLKDGYYWISYEDVNLKGKKGAGMFLASLTKPHDNIYQYDGGTSENTNFVRSGGSIANVFTARANAAGAEELKAVGLRLDDVNVDYAIQVYLNPKNQSDPTSGTPALSAPVTGKTGYVGYYTIDLPEPVGLAEGTKYAVVATLSHGDGSDVLYSVDTTTVFEETRHTSAVSAGQSFERDSANAGWDDLSSSTCDELDEPGSCARIKAFTSNCEATHAQGWSKENGTWYYYGSNQARCKGWLKDGGSWYYLDPATGAMRTGWIKSGSTWYYLASSGAMATGWAKDGNAWYYFSSSGAMKTGWLKLGSNWYYLKDSGAMAVGWAKVGSVWYYFNGSGVMLTGWQRIGGKWYYFNGSGAMLTGWQKLGSNWYYFNSSGVMLTGRQNIGGKWYTFNSSGAWVG